MDGEDRGASGHDAADDWDDDDVDGTAGLRGWIDPDDRLWRHPSESASTGPGPGPVVPSGPDGPVTRGATGPWLVGGATACVIIALVAAGLVLATTDRPGQATGGAPTTFAALTVPTTQPGMRALSPAPDLAAMLRAVRPAMVDLVIHTAAGTTVHGTGLVVEADGIVVTTSPAVPSSRSVTVVDENGNRFGATRVGSDRASGISVLSSGDDVTPAGSDFAGPSGGEVLMAVALDPSRQPGRPPTPVVYAGDVVAAGVALGLDPVSSSFATLGVEAPLSSTDVGCPLLDSGGDVVGMLARAGGTGLAAVSVFLPAELVWGVADQLISNGGVDPGSLGAATTDAVVPGHPPTPVGATVTSVVRGGPADTAGIEAGDVVTAVDGFRVRSRAELDTRLYADAGGSGVAVTIDRSGTVLRRPVVLEDGDDAPGAASSP